MLHFNPFSVRWKTIQSATIRVPPNLLPIALIKQFNKLLKKKKKIFVLPSVWDEIEGFLFAWLLLFCCYCCCGCCYMVVVVVLLCVCSFVFVLGSGAGVGDVACVLILLFYFSSFYYKKIYILLLLFTQHLATTWHRNAQVTFALGLKGLSLCNWT